MTNNTIPIELLAQMGDGDKAHNDRFDKAVKFFYEHAGWSYDSKTQTENEGRLATAKALANAERYAFDQDITFDWRDDDQGCNGCDCDSLECACSTGEPHEVLQCLAYNGDNEIIGGLGGICGATREYRRVVEAELALEGMPSEMTK